MTPNRDLALSKLLSAAEWGLRSFAGLFQTTLIAPRGAPLYHSIRSYLGTLPAVQNRGTFEGVVGDVPSSQAAGFGLKRGVLSESSAAAPRPLQPLPLLGSGQRKSIGYLLPSTDDGVRVVRWEGTLLLVVEEQIVLAENNVEQRLRVTMPGSCREKMERFLAEVLAHSDAQRECSRRIYVFDPDGNGWELLPQRPFRSIDSVLLPDGGERELLEDARRFMASEARYRHLGIPWRRGYLLEGLPGAGKSSLAEAIAGELGLDLYVVSLVGLTDRGLRGGLQAVPRHSAVVVEDVDSGAPSREASPRMEGVREPLSLGALLNALDGPTAADGRLLFLTTNCVDALVPAIIRPGRVDRRVTFGYAQPDQASALFARFFEGDGRAGEFASRVCRSEVTMAAVQALLQKYMDDPDAALDAARGW